MDVCSSSSSSRILLTQAEELLKKEYEPLLLLTLAMDDSTLRTQTCYGSTLLHQLSPLLEQHPENRAQLLREAREMLSSHDGWFCLEMMRRYMLHRGFFSGRGCVIKLIMTDDPAQGGGCNQGTQGRGGFQEEQALRWVH